MGRLVSRLGGSEGLEARFIIRAGAEEWGGGA